MRAMLLCAGFGTRLGSLSDERPKPMLPVCDVPILRYGIAQLVAHGIRDIVINVHHRGDVIERDIGDGSALGARVQYSHEESLLGTGGGLKKALPLLDPDGTGEPFVSMNGKLIFDVDLTAMIASFRTQPDALAMLVVRRVPDAQAWGALDVRTDRGAPRVAGFFGAGEHMFCGVQVVRPSVIARLPDGESDSVRQGYVPWIAAGERVAAFEHVAGYWAEHSTPARYVESSRAILRGARLSHPPATLVGVDPSARIAADAVIHAPVRIGPNAEIGAGAVIGPETVIGTGAVVAPGAVVERSVVWAGARASGRVTDAIVATGGVVSAAG